MHCPGCQKEIVADAYFCNWCSVFTPAQGAGRKANLFARWMALAIDPMIAVVLWFAGSSVFALISEDLAVLVAVLFPFVYFVWYLTLFRKGQTPGKLLLGLQVVDAQTGQIPGFGRMLLREVVGRFVSGLFFGIGYFWAIIDKNGQAWHDKLASTVVLKRA